MVMKRNKLILGIFISLLFIGAVVLGVVKVIDREDSVPVTNNGEAVLTEESIPETNGGDEMTLEEMGLTEEQYQLLKDSIIPASLEQMNAMRRRNAWLMLNAMVEVDFVENTYPGESGVGLAAWILSLLDVGEIEELTDTRVSQGVHDLSDVLIMRFVSYDDNIYYIWYHRTWGLIMVKKDSEDGELIYSSDTHIIVDDGRICGLEHSDPALCKAEDFE